MSVYSFRTVEQVFTQMNGDRMLVVSPWIRPYLLPDEAAVQHVVGRMKQWSMWDRVAMVVLILLIQAPRQWIGLGSLEILMLLIWTAILFSCIHLVLFLRQLRQYPRLAKEPLRLYYARLARRKGIPGLLLQLVLNTMLTLFIIFLTLKAEHSVLQFVLSGILSLACFYFAILACYMLYLHPRVLEITHPEDDG